MLREPAPGGFIDPRRMLAAQLAIAGQQGAEILGEQVVGVERSADGWDVNTVVGSTVFADHVVVAAGPHADEIDGIPRPQIDVVAETVVLAGCRWRGTAAAGGSAVDHRRRRRRPLLHRAADRVSRRQDVLKLGATRHDQWVLVSAARRQWMRGTGPRGGSRLARELMLGVLPGLQADSWSTKPCLIPDTPTKLPYLADRRTGPGDGRRHQRLRGEERRRDRRGCCRSGDQRRVDGSRPRRGRLHV